MIDAQDSVEPTEWESSQLSIKEAFGESSINPFVLGGKVMSIIESEVRDIGPSLEVAQKNISKIKEIIEKQHLSKRIGNKEHIYFEAWQLFGATQGLGVATEWVRPYMEDKSLGVNKGFEARVKVLNGEGIEIGAAQAICSREEDNWKDKPDYQLSSMAQTRAASKALRMRCGWLAVLAGFEGCPAEEMPEDGKGRTRKPPKPSEKDTEGKDMAGDKWQPKFLANMLKMKGRLGEGSYYIVLGNNGFEHADQITDGKVAGKIYDEMAVLYREKGSQKPILGENDDDLAF